MICPLFLFVKNKIIVDTALQRCYNRTIKQNMVPSIARMMEVRCFTSSFRRKGNTESEKIDRRSVGICLVNHSWDVAEYVTYCHSLYVECCHVIVVMTWLV